MELRITAAGRAALADPVNVGVSAVRVTKVLVGSGQGPGGADDDARTVLRNQRDSAVAGGSTAVPARVVVRGDVVATAAYSIAEVGLEAAIGGGQPFLFAYWTNAGQVFAAAAAGVTVVIIAAIDVVAETPAVLTIDLDPTVQANFSSTFAGLTDTQAGALVARNYYRVDAAGGSLVALTAAEVLADLFTGIASARYVRKGGNGFQALTRGEVVQDLLAAIGQNTYLRRAAGGGFEGLTRAEAVHDLLTGLDAGSYPRVRVVAGVRSLEGLTSTQLAAVFIRRWHLAARVRLSLQWQLLGELSVDAGWRIIGRVDLTVDNHLSAVRVRLVQNGQELTSEYVAGTNSNKPASFTVSNLAAGVVRLEALSFSPDATANYAEAGESETFLHATAV